jgi:hypothetical protein
MFGYANNIKSGHSIIYGVFKDDELLYAVEIQKMKIVQALGKFNRQIEEDDRKVIDIWFSEYCKFKITQLSHINPNSL